jgi:uncharacterized membrane protein YtjA (UPF0391 family)
MMNVLATIACLIAVILGAGAIALHADQLQSIVFLVACVWFLSNILVSKAYQRSYWKDHNLTISQFVDRVRIGQWPEKTALEKVTGFGAGILMLTSVGLNFV